MLNDPDTRFFVSPHEPEVRAYERAHRVNPPPHGAVLFYGSSSIRLWTDLASDFPGLPVLNRGYGGSTLHDCVRQMRRLVYPVRPSTIVLYAGDNDLADGRSPEQVCDDFRRFVDKAHGHLGSIPIFFVSIKPAPCRWNNAANIRKTNDLIRLFCQSQPPLTFVDVMPLMLNGNGGPKSDLFQPDRLHLSRAGYDILVQALRPLLA